MNSEFFLAFEIALSAEAPWAHDLERNKSSTSEL
jgi:hypothetical protein